MEREISGAVDFSFLVISCVAVVENPSALVPVVPTTAAVVTPVVWVVSVLVAAGLGVEVVQSKGNNSFKSLLWRGKKPDN